MINRNNISLRQRSLIVNGDDFGFSEGVNHAIIQAHQAGILTSTSLMVTGEAFEEAVELAKSHPQLAIGLHVVLCYGRSVLPPSQIPHLVDEQGNFSNHPEAAGLRYQFSRTAQRELRQEIRAQLERFQQTGLPLSHVDGHLHMHVHPVILQILAELADEFKIRFIRLPFEEIQPSLSLDRSNLITKLVWWLLFGGLRRYGEGVLRKQGIQFSDRVYGLLQTGEINESYLLGLIPKIQSDCVELYAHPDLEKQGKTELLALLSDRVREIVHDSGFQLTNYSQLINE
jgi:hopanoid biosynthesis associated protein HpnK